MVSRAQLDRLVDQVVGSGVSCSHTVAESGHVHSLTAPGAFLEPAETVLWWDFRGSVSSPGTPWTKAEIEQLKRSGVELLLPITRRERENVATLRPVLGARKQLVFMSPRMVGNEPALYHPFRDRIQSLIDGALPIFDLDRHLTDPKAAPPVPLVAPKLYAFPHLRLAGIRRWWKLSGGQYLDAKRSRILFQFGKVYFQSHRLGAPVQGKIVEWAPPRDRSRLRWSSTRQPPASSV